MLGRAGVGILPSIMGWGTVHRESAAMNLRHTAVYGYFKMPLYVSLVIT